MSKTYALKRLLEHGPMTPGEIVRCTRWTKREVYGTAQHLIEKGLIESRAVPKRDGCRVAYEAVL